MNYPGGHVLRPAIDIPWPLPGILPDGSMWCRNCLILNPEPGSECDDEED